MKRMSNKIEEVLLNLTLYEKAQLVVGKTFWLVNGVDRFDIQNILVLDGPHGLRKQGGSGDHLGLNKNLSATCFPTAVLMASTWDRELIEEVGIALGEEFLQEGVSVLLGPGINIKRSPLCGRNFEYYSEDPYVTGEIAASFIQGVQSMGIGTSLKHFAVNNQEEKRMSIDVFVDERTLREIYLAGFEKAVKVAKPWTVMCSYNQVNGTFASENKYLLTDILRNEWGFEGLTVTDWGATNNRVAGIEAGMDLEMPGPNVDDVEVIVKMVEDGVLPLDKLEQAATRVIELAIRGNVNKKVFTYNQNDHHALAKKVACEGSVLLKNNHQILPLKPEESILVIGDFGYKPRYQGAGSSLVNPNRLSIPMKCFPYPNNVQYCKGYDERYEETNHTLVEKAVEMANVAGKVIILAGLTDSLESEGFDRKHMGMPKCQNDLIEAVTAVNKQVVVVLSNGAPVEMPWINKVDGILEMYLAGEAYGEAVWELLYGKVNPSGKLAETFPLKYDELYIKDLFPMGPKGVEYREGLYVGYRYYDSMNLAVRFPFGHGLSYTTFAYGNMELQKNGMGECNYTVSFTVKNVGPIEGSEVAQLYVQPENSTYYKVKKELKGFAKTLLAPGEEKRIEIQLDARSFAHYDIEQKDWVVEKGNYTILIGSSSLQIELEHEMMIDGYEYSAEEVEKIFDRQKDYYTKGDKVEFTKKGFENLYGSLISHKRVAKKGFFNENSTLEELCQVPIGKLLLKAMELQTHHMVEKDDKKTANMINAMRKEIPLRSLSMLSQGRLNKSTIQSIIDVANGHIVKGMKDILVALKKEA